MHNKKYHAKYRRDNIEKRRKWNREWIEKNRNRYNASKSKYKEKLKIETMMHYAGGKPECKLCGIDDIDILCLDHINDNGAEHRRSLSISGKGHSGGHRIYEVLRRDGYPEGLQVLCANCNLKKSMIKIKEKKLLNPFYKEYANKDTI